MISCAPPILSQQKIGAELLQGGDGRVPLSRTGGSVVAPIIDGDREQTVASARIDITTGSQQTLRWRELDSNCRYPQDSASILDRRAPELARYRSRRPRVIRCQS
jgi:hypothetical protein